MYLTGSLRDATLIVGAFLLFSPALRADNNLIVNGGFEAGSLSGWTVTTQNGGGGSFSASSSNSSPLGGYPTPGPSSGTFYAVSDQSGPSTDALSQTFSIPSGPSTGPYFVSFDMFVNSTAPYAESGCEMDYTGCGQNAPEQYATVELLAAGADPLTTDPSLVLATFYMDAPMAPSGDTNPWTNYWFDLSPYVSGGSSYQLVFADVSN